MQQFPVRDFEDGYQSADSGSIVRISPYHNGMFRFVSLLMVFVCTANLLFAASPQKTTDAIVYGGAGVTVDDTIVSGSLVVFPGNVVETHDAHFADLKQPGSTIRLLGHSRARYAGASIELLSGSAVVNSVNAFTVTTPCYSVKALTANARFSVVPYRGHVTWQQKRAVLK